MTNPYPFEIADLSGTIHVAGKLTFTDPSNQPGGGGSQPGTLREYVIPLAFDTPGFVDGIAVYVPTPGDRILAGSGVSATVTWTSPAGKFPGVGLGFADDPEILRIGGSFRGATDASSAIDAHLYQFENGAFNGGDGNFSAYFHDATPIVATLFDTAIGIPSDPAATAGECEIRLLIVHKGTLP